MSLIRKLVGGVPTNKAINSNVNIDLNRLIQNAPVIFYNYDKEDFIKKGYAENAEVYKIVRKIVDKASIAVPYLYIEKSNNYTKFKKYKQSKTTREHVKSKLYRAKSLDYAPEASDLAKLIAKPNSHQTFEELTELRRLFYLLQGECFMAKRTELNSEIPISLEILPANRVQHIYKHSENTIIGWQVDWGKGLIETFEAKDVFHMKMANPLFDPNGDHLRGLSPLVAGLKYLKLDDTSIEAWVKAMQNEGAKGIVSPNHADPKLWLNEEQREMTDKVIDSKIHGFENRNKVVVSGMPLQYTQIGMSPDALNIIQGMKEAQKNLCDLWGVPAELFETGNTFDNQEWSARRFLNEVVLPLIQKEEKALNSWLVEPFKKAEGVNYVLDYDTSMYEELQPTLDDITALEKILTKNELRVIQGYDTLDTAPADMLFINSGLVPINDFEI